MNLIISSSVWCNVENACDIACGVAQKRQPTIRRMKILLKGSHMLGGDPTILCHELTDSSER